MSNVMVFRGEFAFMSNMYSVDFEWDGRMYHNSEAAFQSAKSLNPAERDRFSEMKGAVAKREGKKVLLRGDWNDVKVDIMEEIVLAKFSQNPKLAQKLIATGDMELMEGNAWHDTFWGVDAATGNGENHLGKILMKVRAILGGTDYIDRVAQIRAEKAAAKQKARENIMAQIAEVTAQLEEANDFEFVGKQFGTKAFGTVTIKRQEGDILVFDARGMEKKFALPGCIIQGFLIPQDQSVIDYYKKQDALKARLAQLQEAAKNPQPAAGVSDPADSAAEAEDG